MKEGGTLFLNSNHVNRTITRDDLASIAIPAVDISRKLGSERALNMVMLGAFVAHTRMMSLDSIKNGLSEIATSTKASILKLNHQALDRGAEYILKGCS